MTQDQGLTTPQICRDLNLGETTFRRGVQQCEIEQLGHAGLGSPWIAEQQRSR